MAKAFTPGLTVSARARYRARRALPLEGEVRVKVGDRVEADTVVAQTFMEGDAFPMKVAGMLGAQPKDLPGLMLVKVGDAVRVGQPLARSKGIFGMMRTEAASTADGTVESVSDSTGMVIVRGPRQPIEVRAFVAGTVAEVLTREGAIVENAVALVQGIFGIGGERGDRFDGAGSTAVLFEDEGDLRGRLAAAAVAHDEGVGHGVFPHRVGGEVDRRSSPVSVTRIGGIRIGPRPASASRKKKRKTRPVSDTVTLGTGPPGRPTKPRPVWAYSTTTLAGVIAGNRSHMPASSGEEASPQAWRAPRPNTIRRIAAAS